MIPAHLEDVYPLAPLQQGLLFHSLAAPDSTMYVEQLTWRMQGNLHADSYRTAWQKAVDRHQTLRTGFVWKGLDTPAQVVFRAASLPFREEDWRDLTTAEQEARLAQAREHELRQSFDLTAAPLMRLVLIRLSDDDYDTLWTFHHLLLDGWSIALLLAEVFQRYRALQSGEPLDLPPAAPYSAFVDWIEEQDPADAERFWRETLRGFTAQTTLPVGSVGAGSENATRDPVEHQSWVSERTAEALQALARRERLTLNTIVQGAWALLLSRYSGDEDVVFGSTVSVRPLDVPDIERTLGLMLNALPVRTQVPPDAMLIPWLRELQTQQVEARNYAYSPLIDIHGWSDVPRGDPLFESLLVFENFPFEAASEQAQNLDLTIGTATGASHTNYPLNLVVHPGSQVLLRLQYDPRRFDRGTIDLLAVHLGELLAGIAADPNRRLSELPLLSDEERQRVVVEWNRTERPYPAHETLPSLFAQQVVRTPEAVAVVCGDERLTYRELDDRTNRLAYHLRALGVGPDRLVGVYLERSPDLVVALLAILKAGGAYVPLDPTYPAERLRFMAEDADLAVVVSRAGLVEGIVGHQAAVVCVDADAEAIGGRSDECPEPVATAADLAYVIYTSGSTGRPKGVMLPHGAVVNTLLWLQEAFPLAAEDTVAQKTASSFTDSVWELFWPLLTGSKLAILGDDVVRDPQLLYRALEAERVTVTQFVPPQLAAFLEWLPTADIADPLPALRWIFNGGEALPPSLARAWYARFQRAKIANIYGMTESAIYGTCSIVEPDPDGGEPRILVGKPIGNATAYVLDRWGQPCPPGLPGEIHLGGRGLARGYLNRPDLTAERFIADPFRPGPGARLYKTGDRGRYLPDGNIDYLGRLDDQVKIRGFRVELGEVEATLRMHPGVAEAVAVVREDRPGDPRLVAYVVGVNGSMPPGATELRASLEQRLPEYMVPTAFVALDALPLTPSGKVNRRALPAPFADGLVVRAEYVAPRTLTETLLAGIWANVLGVERVGVRDGFFELGGHSLLATRVLARVRQALGIDLPLRDIVEGRTVEALARRVEAARGAASGRDEVPLVSRPRAEALPLSFGQERLWVLDQLEGGSPRYNIPGALRLRGPLDAAVLERALNALVARHEALRTTFRERDGEPVQVIAPTLELVPVWRDLRSLPTAERASEVARRLAAEALRPFNLAAGPLIRVGVLQVGDEEHVLTLTLHHIVSDGWSMGVLWRDLTELYAAEVQGRPASLGPLAVQYADYAVWQREWLSGERLERQVAYWRDTLAGAPTRLDLPADRPRPAIQDYRGAAVPLRLGVDLTRALQRLAAEHQVTLYMVLLAAFQALLHRYTGQDDLLLGTPTAGRSRVETEDLVGLLVNTLVLRGNLAGDPSFVELLARTREAALDADAHQDLPFERLVNELKLERDLSVNPLVQVFFIMQNLPERGGALAGLEIEPVELEAATTKVDLTLTLQEMPDGLAGVLEYDTALFDRERIERMAGHLTELLAGIAAEPGRRLSELPLLPEDERRQVVEAWNRTERPYDAEATVPAQFARQAAATPEAVALVDGERELTYRELDARANRLAHHLREVGVGPGGLVGVCLERSAELVVALLGILKAGGAYVPLDPGYPAERLAFMLEDSGARALVTTETVAGRVPSGATAVVRFDADADAIAARLPTDPTVVVGGTDLAYVIYTSGSTGRPKGVMLEHRNVAAFFVGMDGALATERPGVWLAVTSVSFDISVLELLWTLCRGFRVVLQPELREVGLDPEWTVARQVARHGVTHLQCTPSLARLVAEDPKGLAALRAVHCLLLGGEALPPELAARLLGDGRRPTLLNMYGPTETTVWSAVHRVEPLVEGPVPIGRPIANTRVYVLDPHGRPQPLGVPGELLIGGAGVARGYLGRPELTAERFVPDRLSTDPAGRLYKTGDLARWRPDGVLEYLGRTDQQVKLRGFRIELGEIEAALRDRHDIADAAAVVREDRPGDPRLVAYLVGADGSTPPGAEALRAALAERLPEYMLPGAFVTLDALPLTPNGKLDRNALPPPDLDRTERTTAYVAPRTQTEQTLAGLWAEILGLERVGIHDNFFTLGGDSIRGIQVVARARKIGLALGPAHLFVHQTIAELAHVATAAAPPEPAVETADAPLIDLGQQQLAAILAQTARPARRP